MRRVARRGQKGRRKPSAALGPAGPAGEQHTGAAIRAAGGCVLTSPSHQSTLITRRATLHPVDGLSGQGQSPSQSPRRSGPLAPPHPWAPLGRRSTTAAHLPEGPQGGEGAGCRGQPKFEGLSRPSARHVLSFDSPSRCEACFPRRSARPTLKCIRECANFVIAEKPSNLRYR